MSSLLWAVTGASGYIGSRLVARLVSDGARVRVLDRRQGRARADVEVVHGDLADTGALAQLAAGAQVVVHLASYVHRPTRAKEQVDDCHEVIVGGTRRLLDAVSRVAPEALFIYTSSASVYGASQEILTEDARCQPETAYGEAKLGAERCVADVIQRGLAAVVLRPAAVIGVGAPANLGRMLRLMQRGFRIELDGGRNLKSLLPVDSLVAAIQAVAARGTATRGQTLNVTGGPPLAMREIGDILCGAIGARPWTIRISSRIAFALARALDLALLPVAPRQISLSRLVHSYASNNVLSDERLRVLTGYAPPVSVADALRADGNSFLSGPTTSSMSA